MGLEFDPIKFNFSHKWLLGFKKANGINRVALHGEGADADMASVQVVRTHLPRILQDVPMKNIYNFDETGEHGLSVMIFQRLFRIAWCACSVSSLSHTLCRVCVSQGLYYRMLASRGNILGLAKDRKGAKKAKDRITVGLFWNATGDDFWEPVFIGTSKQPRCFGNRWTPRKLKARYYSSKKAWINTAIWWDVIRNFNK